MVSIHISYHKKVTELLNLAQEGIVSSIPIIP